MTDFTSPRKTRRQMPYAVLDGAKLPLNLDLQRIRDASQYIPKENDLFVISYPKCGTTWVQYIVYLLSDDAQNPNDVRSLVTRIPFVERDGFPPETEKIIAFKYHLPPTMIPWNPKARYIYVARNVLDAVVSYYYFFKSMRYNLSEDISFDDCLESFLSGNCIYGDYFEHLVAWYERRNEPNVLFLTFESMKKDHRGSVMKIARFIGKDLSGTGENLLNDVLKYSHITYMKDNINSAMSNYVFNGPLTTFNGTSDLVSQKEAPKVGPENSENKIVMVRKGKAGDWKNHFSKEQKDKTIALFLEKTRHSDVHRLWPEIFEDDVIQKQQ